MKFRFYITNLFDGVIQGTDSASVAAQHSLCEDFYVVDTETGMWLAACGPLNIEDIQKDEEPSGIL